MIIHISNYVLDVDVTARLKTIVLRHFYIA